VDRQLSGNCGTVTGGRRGIGKVIALAPRGSAALNRETNAAGGSTL
jgi:hypothetical protein